MIKTLTRFSSFILLLLICTNLNSFAQNLIQPPNGDNNRSVVTQYIGSLVSVTVTYNSPNVTGPAGEDRKGKIWGELVPYGFNDLGFGTSKEAPWRAGSNENTTITFSHDVMVQDKPLKAGTYGFFIVAQKEGPWTLIFSNNSTSWGSFFYDQSQDALRVTTLPQEAPFHEWLTYEFTDRELDHTTCALLWENKMIPFSIKVPNMTQLYVDNMRRQLQNSTGFDWQNWNDAATFLLTNKTNLDEALKWSENSISLPFVGVENFTTLSTKSQILDAMGKKDESKELMEKAIRHPTATPLQVHFYGRQLLGQGKKEDAMKVFQMNEKQHPTEWVVNVGMARGYSAMGNYKSALKYAKIAYEKAPDPQNKESMKQAVAKLENGQDIN
ncbi:MAG TPA: DUF2911 domain-containing protein [Chitinophagales bacterium]|nr:DUF2911 domain-containing protein [Chitinophagales bacterium]